MSRQSRRRGSALITRRGFAGAAALALALLTAGCAGGGLNYGAHIQPTAASPALHRPGSVAAAAPGRTSTSARPGTTGPVSTPIWFQSLQMTSAATGWALAFPAAPATSADPAAGGSMLVARTADSARTWADVTPAAARPMLTSAFGSPVIDPVDGEHAYLAVTAAAEDPSVGGPGVTTVFATADGGRSWTESTPVRAAGTVLSVSFADPRHGWLLLAAGDGVTGHPLPWLFRTVDGGRRWTVAASAPPPGSDFCQKLGITFATAATGWLTISCRSGAYLVVSRDGGATWTEQPLPLTPDPCTSRADRVT